MPPQKKTKWQQKDVQQMLTFIARHNYAKQLMASTNLQNQYIYDKVAENLQKAGYEHTAQQCRTKFKNLKIMFMDALKDRQSNTGETCSSPPFFNQLQRLWKAAEGPQRKNYRKKAAAQRVEAAPLPQLEEEAEAMEKEARPQLRAKEQEGIQLPSNSPPLGCPSSSAVPGPSGEQQRPREQPAATTNLPSPANTAGSIDKGILKAIHSLEEQRRTMRSMMRQMQKLEQDMRQIYEQLWVQ